MTCESIALNAYVSTGVPFCFTDDRYSQGGAVCPDDIETTERIDCHPEPGVGEEACLKRGCYYCEGIVPQAGLLLL